jgi:hypothetical protein
MAHLLNRAEGEGFEPTVDCSTPVFKTGAIVHSAIPPDARFFRVSDSSMELRNWSITIDFSFAKRQAQI